MKIKAQKSLGLALGYTALIFASLYWVPFLAQFLRSHEILKTTIELFNVILALSLVTLFLFKYQIQSLKAYGLFFLLFFLLFFELAATELLVERLHYLEYGLLFALWFRAFRHFFHPRVFHYGATLWFVFLLGCLDEGAQFFLPNRHFDWTDIYRNTCGSLFGMAAVMILMYYRQDGNYFCFRSVSNKDNLV